MEHAELKKILDAALKQGADFAEIFIEQKESTAISCEDEKIEKINTGIDYGMGIRVIAGEGTSYVHSNDVTFENGIAMAELAGQIAQSEKGTVVKEFQSKEVLKNDEILVHPAQIPFEQKVTLIRAADNAARMYDRAITQVTIGYSDIVQHVQIANNRGVCVDGRKLSHTYHFVG